MKARITILALIFVATAATAQSTDRWTGPDKKLHAAGSALAGAIAGSLLPEQPFRAWLWSQAPGLIKEATDPVWSWKDIGVNAIFGAIGVSIGRKFLVTPNSVTYSQRFW